MLSGLPADARRFRHPLQATLHRLEYRFVLPTANAPVVPRRALGLHRAAWTGRCPVAMLEQPVLNAAVTPDRPLTGRASVLIAARVIAEVPFVELPFGQVVGCMGLRYQHVDPGLLALEDLGTGVIASICQGGK